VTSEPTATDNPRLARVLERLDQEKLPGMPAVAARLNQLLCQDTFEISEVVETVESDMALAARLLKVVNSAAVGLRSPATSVERAVLMLGLKGVRNMAMSLALVHGIPSPRNSLFDQDLFWRDSIRRAVAARVLAGHWPDCDKEEAYLGALLQDLALPILLLSLGPDYGRVLREWTSTGQPLYTIENQKLGWDHMDIGAWLARRWQFDDGIVAMIAGHHHAMAGGPDDTPELLCVQLSAIVPSTKARDRQPLKRLCDALGQHNPRVLETIEADLAKIDEQFESTSEAFQVRRGWTLPLVDVYRKMAEAG